jgi:hypothetical protein
VTERVRRAVKSIRQEHLPRPRHGDTGVLRAPPGAGTLAGDGPEAPGGLLLAELQEALGALRRHDHDDERVRRTLQGLLQEVRRLQAELGDR